MYEVKGTLQYPPEKISTKYAAHSLIALCPTFIPGLILYELSLPFLPLGLFGANASSSNGLKIAIRSPLTFFIK